MIFVHVRKYFLHVHVHFSKTGEDFVKKNSLVDNEHINRSLEMTPDARTNAGKHITSNIACASSQRYIKDSVSDSDCPKWCCVLWHSISFRPLLDHLKWRLSMHQLMFPQPVWWTIWIDVRSVERREILQCHNFALSFGLIEKSKYFVNCPLRTYAMFDVTRFNTFFRALDVISSLLLIVNSDGDMHKRSPTCPPYQQVVGLQGSSYCIRNIPIRPETHSQCSLPSTLLILDLFTLTGELGQYSTLTYYLLYTLP